MHCRVSCSWPALMAVAWGLSMPAYAQDQEGSGPAALPPDENPRTVRFNRDVRPILADHCFQCHGPDNNSRQAGLRLDQRDGLFGNAETRVIVPGDPKQSALWRRITHDDPDLRMPPVESKKPLSKAQVDTLRRWIEQGAVWEDHWAFLPLQRPPVPERPGPRAKGQREGERPSANPIDAFILEELDRHRLSLSPEASPETLIRRVTLDLTGLPPTLEEIDAYLADQSPDRYERLVDRLLASPRYGEQMAVAWLDAARYADTSGYQNDGPREMWRWRDWVIEAFNSNMPFDQFTVEQLAGDLLPAATLSQRVATGFNRNHRGNAEGGIVPEEYAVEYVADRVDTTGTVWLGLTIGCARCHEHKFDPISQQDYYRLFAYFNNIPEFGRAIKEGNSPPYLLTPTPRQQAELEALDQRLAAARTRWQQLQPDVEQAQQEWERNWRRDDWTMERGIHLQALKRSDPDAGSHRFNGERFLEFPDHGKFGYRDKFSVTAWVQPDGNATGGIVSKMDDDSDRHGWAFDLQQGKLQVNLSRRWLDDALRVETESTLPAGRWRHIAMTYDGSRRADGVEIYVDGIRQPKVVILDLLNQTMANDEPLRIGSTGTLSRFTGGILDVRIYERTLAEWEVQVIANPSSVGEILLLPTDEREARDQIKLREAFLATAAPDEMRHAVNDLRRFEEERAAYVESLPTTMVMLERDQEPRAAVLDRGEYNRPGEMVTPAIPQALLQGEPPDGRDRLALARWIVAPDNPLTARVAVNREWQRFFGIGLVKTSEDFGTQAEPPSHPELLDWLATEFIRTGWDVKWLQRLIVTSASYRQTSAADPGQFRRDPENRLLARGPRFRLSAEMIRDLALFTSGLLHESSGGPSFFPYQPEGLWKEIATDTQYERSRGPDLYRRTLYSYWKRTVSNPTLAAFDAPSREACMVRRSRTNTPLQALTLLNDVTFVESARKLAERSFREGDDGDEARVAWMFRTVTGRVPSADETVLLTRALDWHRSRFRTNEQGAASLLTTGDSPVDPSLPAIDLAAHAAVANVILNLDEAVTRE